MVTFPEPIWKSERSFAEHAIRLRDGSSSLKYFTSSEPDENSEEESYIGVEDEEILNKVFEIFKEKFKDDFDFVD